MNLGLSIDFIEKVEGTEPAPLGSVAYNPFDVDALLTSLTAGSFGELLIAATPVGVSPEVVTDVDSIGVALKVTEELIVPPPPPVLKKVSTTTLGNLLTLTGSFSDQSLGGLIFGIDVSAITTGVSVFFKLN